MEGHRRFFICGNWKRKITSARIGDLVPKLNAGAEGMTGDVEVVIAPPFVYLDRVRESLSSKFGVAAPNCWTYGAGKPCTGEVSAKMLVDIGVSWVILGHPDRRQMCGETVEDAAKKAEHAISSGLKVIGCIGETLQEHQQGKMLEVLGSQMRAYKSQVTDWSKMIIAYEPVWAIGTGVVASPEDVQEVHAFLRSWAHRNLDEEVAESIRIIYGGSIDPDNCYSLAECRDVDGFLVGAASLDSDTFLEICKCKGSLPMIRHEP